MRGAGALGISWWLVGEAVLAAATQDFPFDFLVGGFFSKWFGPLGGHSTVRHAVVLS